LVVGKTFCSVTSSRTAAAAAKAMMTTRGAGRRGPFAAHVRVARGEMHQFY
jgi:hypothetical protein